MNWKNIAAAQSGGPTCAINATLAGIVAEGGAQKEIERVYGYRNGVEGLLSGRYADLTNLTDEDLRLLACTPSTALGSCRKKLPTPEEDPGLYQAVLDELEARKVGAFFYIGGNDSMDTACKLARYAESKGSGLRVIGVPKTIDNDVMNTDHTPGFGSAAKYVATTLREIIRDSQVYDMESVTIVEVMGRDAGWLTASACVLHTLGEKAPHFIYLPEAPFSPEEFLEDLRGALKEHQSVVCAVSEGLRLADGTYVAENAQSGVVDVFGHRYLSGLGKYLENLVQEKIGCKVRSIELNVLQRCASHLASAADLRESSEIGREAVRAALRGETGKMMSFTRIPEGEECRWEIHSVSLDGTANQVRQFPREWINDRGNQVIPEAASYFLPLMAGEVSPPRQNGLPRHFVL